MNAPTHRRRLEDVEEWLCDKANRLVEGERIGMPEIVASLRQAADAIAGLRTQLDEAQAPPGVAEREAERRYRREHEGFQGFLAGASWLRGEMLRVLEAYQAARQWATGTEPHRQAIEAADIQADALAARLRTAPEDQT